MLEENPTLHDRWVAMVERGKKSQLATKSHDARVLYETLVAKNNCDKEVQHDPLVLCHLEPNYAVSPTTRPGLVLRSELGYVQGCSPLRVGKTNPSRVDDLSYDTRPWLG